MDVCEYAAGTSRPALESCTMLCRSSLSVPSPLLLPLLLVLSLPVHCTCTMSLAPTTSSLGVKSYSVAGYVWTMLPRFPWQASTQRGGGGRAGEWVGE